MLGGAFGHIIRPLFPGLQIEIGAYALVGMAAVFAAAARAPLTAMLIVFEMSNDYQLILPLMAAGMTASYVAQWLHPDSIYTIKLTKRGIRFEQGHDMDIMQGVQVNEVMNTSPVTVRTNESLAHVYALFQKTLHQGFPVLDESGQLYGFISMQDIHRTLEESALKQGQRDSSLQDITIKEVATTDPVTVFPDDPIWSAIRKMAPRDLARLPVVDRHDPTVLLGLISRSDILRAYQVGLMRKQQDITMRERLLLRRSEEVEFLELKADQKSRCIGKKISELGLHQSTSVVSITRHDTIIFPTSSSTIQPGDQVTLFCRSQHCQELSDLFTDFS
jgi:CIC family chloride channel protein